MNHRLTPEAIRAAWPLRPHDAIVGCRLCCFDRIDSTNTWLRRASLSGAPEGTVALAEYQTAGRGQYGRSWVAPPGTAVLSSTLLRPNLSPDRLPSLTMLAGCAAVAAVDQVLAQSGTSSADGTLVVGLKWPNDVIAVDATPSPMSGRDNGARGDHTGHDPISPRYRKLGGVLIEGTFEDARLACAVVGIGINANFDPSDYPEIAATATSLQRLAGGPIYRPRFVAALLDALDARYRLLHAGNVADIYAEWRERLAILGRRVVLRESGAGHTASDADNGAVAEDVLPTGELILRAEDGRRRRVAMGEVSLTVL